MLPKRQRLGKRELAVEYLNIPIPTPLFSVRVRHNGLAYNRYAVIMSKKAVGKAVMRNRLKRGIFSLVQNWPAAGKDYIFILRVLPSSPHYRDVRAAMAAIHHALYR